MEYHKHTPTPWGFTGEPNGYTIWQTARGCQSHPQAIARVVGGRVKVDEEEANASYIVRAVNSHAALVEALRQTQSDLDAYLAPTAGEVNPYLRNIRARCRAALALAGDGK